MIEVGRQLGGLTTIGLVVFTAFAGTIMLRYQGYQTLNRARQRAAEGAVPIREMSDGIFLAVGGILLLTPGFITDFIGCLCLIPGVRHLIIAWLLRRFLAGGRFSVVRRSSFTSRENPSGDTFDGEYTRDKDDLLR